jgi:hypothetical protein
MEHRMFCHITQNWRGRPLVSREVVVNLIGNTTTDEGLRIQAQLDENTYEAGIKVSDRELAELAIRMAVSSRLNLPGRHWAKHLSATAAADPWPPP